MRSTYSIKLELLPDSRIRIEQVNSFKLKLNLLITLFVIAYLNNILIYLEILEK